MTEIEIGAWQGLLNAGGVSRLRLVRLPDVISITVPTTGVEMIAGSVVLTENAEITEIRFGDRGCSYQVTEVVNDAGESYNIQISADIPRVRANVLGFFLDRSQYRWLAFIEDYNKTCLLLGNPDANGLSLLVDHASGKQSKDKNAQRLSLQGSSWNQALIYDLFTIMLQIDNTPPSYSLRVSRYEHFEQSFEFKKDDGTNEDMSEFTFGADVFNNQGFNVFTLSSGNGLQLIDFYSLSIELTTAQMGTLAPSQYKIVVFGTREGERDDFVTIYLQVV